MNEFLSKLSLYDFLTTVLLGGCLYVPLSACAQFELLFADDMVITIGFCYLAGLLSHKISESLDWSSYWNKKNCLKAPLRMAIVSLICRNQRSIIARARRLVGYSSSDDDIMSEYLSIYYDAMKRNCLGNITKIEAHSAFVKDLSLVILPVFVIVIICDKNIAGCFSWICLIVSVLIIEAVLCVIRYNSELKIHKLVWEYKKYVLPNMQNEI